MIVYRPAKFLKKGDKIRFSTDNTLIHEVEAVEEFWDRGWSFEIRAPVVGVMLTNGDGYVEYHPANPIPVLV